MTCTIVIVKKKQNFVEKIIRLQLDIVNSSHVRCRDTRKGCVVNARLSVLTPFRK